MPFSPIANRLFEINASIERERNIKLSQRNWYFKE